MKVVEFSKLANLKVLSFFMCNLDNRWSISSDRIFELVGFLPKLQELHLDFVRCKIIDGGAKRRFPITFPSLKTLKLTSIDLDSGPSLSCAFEMISSFPNLQTLEISAYGLGVADSTQAFCSLEIDYNTMALLRLQSVVFTYSTTSENEVCLIKYLLVFSPYLKKIVIRPRTSPSSGDQFKFARKLVKLHRASPVVDIDLS
ncbi:uncharacterized protein LOC143591686 [Bidens hawaiensis]|uniref:uncharacterized protein LOC143591686 n=1 Tax=Bidens hawaiensis TaxID=980011 RepID=UPI00404B16C6